MGNCCAREAREWHLIKLEGSVAAFYVCAEHRQLHELHFLMRLHEAGVVISDKELACRRELADKILRGEDPIVPGDAVSVEAFEQSLKEVTTPRADSAAASESEVAPLAAISATTSSQKKPSITEVPPAPPAQSTGWFAVLCGCGPAF